MDLYCPNTDFLQPDIRRNAQGYVETSSKLETAQKGVWAIGAVRSGFGGTQPGEVRRMLKAEQGRVAASAEWLARAVGIATPARLASTLPVSAADPSERLVALCRAVGADTYLAGRDGARYLDAGRFAAASIAVEYQDYKHPVYAQLHGEFAPFLSGLDLLLTHGDDALAAAHGVLVELGDGGVPVDGADGLESRDGERRSGGYGHEGAGQRAGRVTRPCSWASTAAITAMLTISLTSGPRWSTCTGCAMPTRMGPIAWAPPIRSSSL